MPHVSIFFLVLALSITWARATEPVPGDSCASYPEGAVMRSGGPETGGVHYVMVCEEGIWGGGDPCSLDGLTVSHGDSGIFYSAEENANCASISQSRSCINGNFDGSSSYQFANCSPPVSGCSSIGDECDDGSFYIGNSPEDGSKVYMTASTYEAISVDFSDNGTGCSSSYCGDGTIATSYTDGRANTAALLAFSPDGFPAAGYCAGLTGVHGHSDWYLPAGGNTTGTEQHLFYTMKQAVGTVDGIGTDNNYYWSSTEASSSSARYQRFNDGAINAGTKTANNEVRCVRR